jgi:hypothetical protein
MVFIGAIAVATDPARSQSPPTLAMGTPLTFLLDDTVTIATVRVGTTFRLHLVSELDLGAARVADAGTRARLRVMSVIKPTAEDPRHGAVFAIEEFRTNPGTVPVRPDQTVVRENLASGASIAAKTEASLVTDGSRIAIQIPLPFVLSGDRPYNDFTPIPLKTASNSKNATPPPKPTRAPTVAPSAAPREIPTPSST